MVYIFAMGPGGGGGGGAGNTVGSTMGGGGGGGGGAGLTILMPALWLPPSLTIDVGNGGAGRYWRHGWRWFGSRREWCLSGVNNTQATYPNPAQGNIFIAPGGGGGGGGTSAGVGASGGA